ASIRARDWLIQQYGDTDEVNDYINERLAAIEKKLDVLAQHFCQDPETYVNLMIDKRFLSESMSVRFDDPDQRGRMIQVQTQLLRGSENQLRDIKAAISKIIKMNLVSTPDILRALTAENFKIA